VPQGNPDLYYNFSFARLAGDRYAEIHHGVGWPGGRSFLGITGEIRILFQFCRRSVALQLTVDTPELSF
jgi:hypothetical protein